MIPAEHRQSIISNGMHFMRAITDAYGPDAGLALWDQICSVLDPDVRGQIFLALITGTYNDRIVLQGMEADVNRVSAVKELRTWAGLSLREAINIIDALQDPSTQQKQIFITVDPKDHGRALRGLTQMGFKI